MKKKTKIKVKSKSKSKTISPTKKKKSHGVSELIKFKKLMATKLGKVDWSKVGVYGFIALVLAAAAGTFGPKLQVAAVVIIKKSIFVAV